MNHVVSGNELYKGCMHCANITNTAISTTVSSEWFWAYGVWCDSGLDSESDGQTEAMNNANFSCIQQSSWRKVIKLIVLYRPSEVPVPYSSCGWFPSVHDLCGPSCPVAPPRHLQVRLPQVPRDSEPPPPRMWALCFRPKQTYRSAGSLQSVS